MRSFIKNIIPPLFWEYLVGLKTYIYMFKYKKILSNNIALKDIHKGKRCFILGSGPSIKKQDLSPLKNEIVFALNNFYVHEEFSNIISNTNVEKYYMTAPIHPPQTEEEWKDWFIDIEKNVPLNVKTLFGLNGNKINIKYIFEKYGLFKQHTKFWYFEGKHFRNDKKLKGMDVTKAIYSGESVSVYTLILAIYMGFSEIYLLGMDHDYFLYDDESQMRMYKTSIHQNSEFERTFGDTFYIKEFLRQYNIFSKYHAFGFSSNSKIYNASAGGILKVFPKVNFENLFKK